MNTRKELGKIERASFGIGGYQDAQIGLWLTLSGKGWGVGTEVNGGWSLMIPVDKYTKWTEADRDKNFAECMRKVNKILSDADVRSIEKLIGIPVEAEFEGNVLKDWRVLTEVL